MVGKKLYVQGGVGAVGHAALDLDVTRLEQLDQVLRGEIERRVSVVHVDQVVRVFSVGVPGFGVHGSVGQFS